MSQQVELNQGEIRLTFTSPEGGKLKFSELGLKDENLSLDGGLLRLVFDLDQVGDHRYYQVPTIEVAYREEMDETHWQCDFNGEMILDKTDHHGHSTVILLDRNKLVKLEQRHENRLVLHAEFPGPVHLLAEDSYIHFYV
ncbi:MAG: hypothetical protein EP338_14160 [Bacteroidetes bacterium]|nr:MAG: hypothetical protein EP338_14160 [Bacteroidota bacterium]